MKKQSRGKPEMQSGRRLQERRDVSRRRKYHRTKTCTSFSGWWTNSRAQLVLTGRGAGAHSKWLILETQMLPSHPGYDVVTSTWDSQAQVLLEGRMTDGGSFPAIKEPQTSLRVSSSPPLPSKIPQWCLDQRHFLQGTHKIKSYTYSRK